ncbi:hypothetical protein HOS78_gp095 [Lactobacillus phage Bacchae]|uniref:Uncharacterized protein n=1 Tax=Lactobacillus phage Bacchae TaxID=2079429 RepID=A0A2K9VCS6_9CAUD|nr:hypothetical protein HOS78_gp095 [Lactobacillus phage Bacchae]AUV60031.1 hypothetical protein [Lactobacillus phage Bacchae]
MSWFNINKRCPYCTQTMPFMSKKGIELRIVYGNQLFTRCESKQINTTINYCPMCGRKLEGIK